MIARDRTQEAIDELYGGDPAEFLSTRKELAARARAAKERDAAKAIAALRKPTRSAHLLNQLARREPERLDALLRLTDDPASSGRSRRDALKAMRELTTRRRRLIDQLADRAFAGAGEDSPTTALRDEVVATLNAALGDPDVGAELAEGRLIRSHEWAGFGFSAADLALVPDDEPDADEEDADHADGDLTEDGDADIEDGNPPADGDADIDDEDSEDTEDEEEVVEDDDPDDDDPDDDEDAGDSLEADDDSDNDMGDDPEDDLADAAEDSAGPAREALRSAERDVKAQQRCEREQQGRVADLEDELAEAQIRLDEIRVAIRRAEMVHRRARIALERLDGSD